MASSCQSLEWEPAPDGRVCALASGALDPQRARGLSLRGQGARARATRRGRSLRLDSVDGRISKRLVPRWALVRFLAGGVEGWRTCVRLQPARVWEPPR